MNPRLNEPLIGMHFLDTMNMVNILAILLDGADRIDGSRQSWKYSSYPNNRSATFVPSPSLPVYIDENIILQRLPRLPRRSFRGLFFRQRNYSVIALFNYEKRYSDERK